MAGTWNGYQPLTVRPFVVRSINETVYTNYQDYAPVPGATGAFQHTDDFYRVSLGLLYAFQPQLQVGPLYEFSAGNGPDPNTSQNFTRHVIMLRFVAKR